MEFHVARSPNMEFFHRELLPRGFLILKQPERQLTHTNTSHGLSFDQISFRVVQVFLQFRYCKIMMSLLQRLVKGLIRYVSKRLDSKFGVNSTKLQQHLASESKSFQRKYCPFSWQESGTHIFAYFFIFFHHFSTSEKTTSWTKN